MTTNPDDYVEADAVGVDPVTVILIGAAYHPKPYDSDDCDLCGLPTLTFDGNDPDTGWPRDETLICHRPGCPNSADPWALPDGTNPEAAARTPRKPAEAARRRSV